MVLYLNISRRFSWCSFDEDLQHRSSITIKMVALVSLAASGHTFEVWASRGNNHEKLRCIQVKFFFRQYIYIYIYIYYHQVGGETKWDILAEMIQFDGFYNVYKCGLAWGKATQVDDVWDWCLKNVELSIQLRPIHSLRAENSMVWWWGLVLPTWWVPSYQGSYKSHL